MGTMELFLALYIHIPCGRSIPYVFFFSYFRIPAPIHKMCLITDLLFLIPYHMGPVALFTSLFFVQMRLLWKRTSSFWSCLHDNNKYFLLFCNCFGWTYKFGICVIFSLECACKFPAGGCVRVAMVKNVILTSWPFS